MKKIATIALALLGVLAAGVGGAHAEPRRIERSGMTISVVHTGDDSVGRRFAYAVREKIRESASYLLTQADVARIEIHIVTLDASSLGNTGLQSAVSIVFVGAGPKVPPIYLDMEVRIVGRQRIHEAAEDVVAAIDQLVQ